MTDTQQRAAAKAFAKNWKDRGYEKGDSQIFWVELLTTVFGVTEISQFISFEDQVHLDHTSFIDGYIEKTHVMIEQKSINKSLTAAIRQSDGSMLTPFEQAKRYSSELPYSKRPRWIVTSNFQSFYIYDMEKPGGDPEIIQLENLEKEYYRLQFLVDEGNTNLQREMEVSIAAGEIVGLLYDALAKQYADPTTERAMKSLNILCVRMVFCLYAEDAGIFGQHGMFHDYLKEFDARKMRKAMIELFQILDTKPEDRDPYLKDDNPQLAAFPYVNGGLFANEDIEIPPFTDEIRNLLLEKASADFDWSEISPTIFGAVFESTLNPETRRSGGMHYTSIENIHKVIDPLFLDDLKNELKEIQQITVQRTKDKKLRDFQMKLANLRWLDPASGSGNFLTETYISIRRLENEVIKELQRGQITFTDSMTREYDLDGYVIIFTSNLPNETEYKKVIPPELQTRFDLVCEFEEPTAAEKKDFLDLLLERAKSKYSEQFASITMTEDEKQKLYSFDYSSISALRDIKRLFNNRLMDYFAEKDVL